MLYETEDARCPISEFLDTLRPKLLAKTIRTIELLKNNGTDLREPYSKCIGEGIFELRTKQGNDITRILYFFVVEQTAVLTNGFIKKSNKMPIKELEIAKKYRQDYMRRLADEKF